MGSGVRLRADFSASELRLLAKQADDAGHVRRLLSLAAILDGMSHEDAAEIGAMDWTGRRCAIGCTASTPSGKPVPGGTRGLDDIGVVAEYAI
jgi:hypothetical protein